MTHVKPFLFNALCFLLVLCCCWPLSAQGLVKIIGDEDNNVISEIEVVNGELYAAGYVIDAMGSAQAVMAKYTLDGNRVWETRLEFMNSYLVDFAQLPNGDIYAIGNVNTDPNDANTRDALIAHFAPNGTLIEARTYNFPGRDYLRKIEAKPDGSGLIAIGQDNRGATGISDEGLIYNITPNLASVSILRHGVGAGDSEWAQGVYFSPVSPDTMFIYGISPELGGDGGLALANANGIISSAFRINAPGTTSLFINDLKQGGAGADYYLGGRTGIPGNAYVASLDHGFNVRWAFDIPQFQRVDDISTPDASGNFHVIAFGYNGTTQSGLLELQETPTGLQLISAVLLQDGATNYNSLADLDVVGPDVFYAHTGENMPDGFGGMDILFARLDLSKESCIAEFIDLELVPREAVTSEASYYQNDSEVPATVIEGAREIEMDQFNLCCGSLVFAEPPYTYECSPAPTYTFTFDIQNYTTFPVTSVLIKNNVDPAQNIFLNLNASPIPPGGVLTGQQFTLVLPGPLTSPQDVCFDVIFLTDGEECCHFEQCIEILPPDPCESISVNYEQIYEGVEEGECCYDLQLVNDFCDEYFLNVTTEILTPGVTFTNFNSTLLNATINGSETEIVWDNPGGFLPLGPLDDMTFCLGNIGSTSQIPQEVAVHWFANDPVTGQPTIVCSDTLVVECQPCMILEDEELVCDPSTGNAVYNFTVTNMSSYQIEDIVLESQTPGINIIPPFIPVNLAPAAPPTPGGTYTGSVQFENTGGWPPGTVVQFRVVLLAADGWCCHLEVEAVIPECTDQNVNCDCTDVEGFELMLSEQAGLSHTVNCNNGTITLATNTLTECERTRWVLNYPGQDLLVEQFGIGNQPVTFEILANGEYQLLLEVVRYDDNGEPCQELPVSSIEYLFVVDCVNIVVDEDPDEGVDIDWPPVVQLQPLQPTASGKAGFWVYPSPVVQTLNLSLESEGRYQIQIFTVSGIPIQTYGLDWEKGQVEKIDVQAWPAGIYYLKATSSEGQVYQTRFVKQ